MRNLLGFTGQMFSSSDRHSFITKSLSVIAVQERNVKKSLNQSQDCGNLVLVKVKSNMRIIVYLYCFYGHEFML